MHVYNAQNINTVYTNTQTVCNTPMVSCNVCYTLKNSSENTITCKLMCINISCNCCCMFAQEVGNIVETIFMEEINTQLIIQYNCYKIS